MTADAPSRRLVIAYAGLVFAMVAPVAYVAQRLYGRYRAPGVINPAMIIASTHVAYYWRVAVATWFGVAVAILVARPLAWQARSARAWTIASVLSMALCVALAWLYP